MCEAHSSVIDDPSSLDAYPATLLRMWKKAQFKEFMEVQMGWALGDDAAEIVRRAERSGTGMSISHSHLDLGGRGGNTPGAGGGGGAAIGANARAGVGGKGGDICVDRGPFTLPFSGPIFPFEIEPAVPGKPFPGAGGGGAGSIGPNSIAGDGGDGGDSYISTIDIEALNAAGFSGTAQVEVGEGGKPGRLPGELPSEGGTALLRFLHLDGTVLKEVKAKGGASPGPKLPDGVRELAEADFLGGFQVTTLMPVNSAELRDGLVYILGGNWRWINLAQLQGDLLVNVLGSLRWRDLNIKPQGLGFHLFLVAPSGKRIAHRPVLLPPDLQAGGGVLFLEPIGANVSEQGEYSLQVMSGEFLLAETLIRVNVPETNPATS